MQRNIKSLIGYSIGATDGEIGQVKEFYFDDLTWDVRYVIVETGNWLNGRKVIIAPEALLNPDWKNEVFPVNLSKEQIQKSPNIDTDKPVSRQQEIALYGHYAWQRYGGNGFYAGGLWAVLPELPIVKEEISQNEGKGDYDLHLRSTETVTGYNIHATNGDIGHINDFTIDDETWKLSFAVVDTHNWFGGKKVLIPVNNIKEVQWENSIVILNITMDEVKNSKLFNEDEFKYMENNKL